MIDLPYPSAILWPNGRGNRYAKAHAVKQHRQWAFYAAKADATRPEHVGRLIVTLYPKPSGPVPDADNIVAALKSYIDGIADACGVNDRDWPAPTILIGERCALGKVMIAMEPLAKDQ